MLRIDAISKVFGGFQALTNVSLSVAKGERRAIIGPNGAGKSTLFNILGGQASSSRGRIYLEGEDVTRRAAHEMWARGLSRTFQRNQLFRGLTAAQNLRLAALARRGLTQRMLASVRGNVDVDRDVIEGLETVRLLERRHTPVKDMAYGEQRQLELALALVGQPKLLLLDEPTAGMSPGETTDMLAMLGALPRDITIMIVEHDMDVIFALADSVTVLNLGEVLAEGSLEEIQSNKKVMDVYLGHGAG